PPLVVGHEAGMLTSTHEKLWEGVLSWLRTQKCRASITVTVPHDCPVTLNLVSADAVVTGKSGGGLAGARLVRHSLVNHGLVNPRLVNRRLVHRGDERPAAAGHAGADLAVALVAGGERHPGRGAGTRPVHE